jgi:hypothetical protein
MADKQSPPLHSDPLDNTPRSKTVGVYDETTGTHGTKKNPTGVYDRPASAASSWSPARTILFVIAIVIALLIAFYTFS